jgi:hypothetical protein
MSQNFEGPVDTGTCAMLVLCLRFADGNLYMSVLVLVGLACVAIHLGSPLFLVLFTILTEIYYPPG